MFRMITALSFAMLAHVCYAQGLAEQNATMNGMDTLNQSSVGPGPGSIPQIAPGAPGGLPNPAGGLTPPPPIGLPGVPPTPAPAGAAYPGLTVPGGQNPAAVGGVPGQPAAATPTPIPTIRVLVGKRVTDAVTGALLEDAVLISVPQTDQDKYLDDGIHDNGVAGDGIRGNVETFKDKYIGAETNAIKNRLINMVRHAEALTPMEFYRYHIMAVDPTTQHRDMPNLLEKEAQRDETLRDWNNKFLADYRIDKNDPRSEFFQLYVPEPPLLPENYPRPPGYVPPQKLAPGQTPSLSAPQAGPGGQYGGNAPGAGGVI